MTFEEFQNIFQTPALLPWEHDYYVANFIEPKNNQEFLDYAYANIENLNGIWYETHGTNVYFLVKKDTIISDDFADKLEAVTDVPVQPVEEGTV